ncbi:SCO4225 family membrane protein [Streptomyces sp. NPDC085927]|uniref:SCO4225 family membrane protein n=1 Tax=Streptomyces sp. NPDC085927 TaxID=3365738 RepID=UPI0037CEC426
MTDSGRSARPARPVRSLSRWLRRVFFGDVLALVYLGICAALLVWAVVVTVAGAGEDASFAGIIPLLAAAPVSLVLFGLPGGAMTFIGAVAGGALVNAAVIGWCARVLRRGGRPDLAG